MAGFLDDLTTVFQHLGLALHFKTHGLFNRPQRVDVFGFRPGAKLGGVFRAERDVGIHAHGPLIHACIRNTQGFHQVTQRRDVGACNLRGALTCAFDGLGHNLNERHTGAVAVHKRACCAVDASVSTAEVSELAGVFLHVGAFNLHAPFRAVVEHDVKVAVVGDGFVVLGDLVVFRLVRVEVVLPGKT